MSAKICLHQVEKKFKLRNSFKKKSDPDDLVRPIERKTRFWEHQPKKSKVGKFQWINLSFGKNSSKMFLWTPKNQYGGHQSIVLWSKKKEQLDRFFE